MHCPLCRHDRHLPYHQDAHRPYRQCEHCRLVFVPPEYRLAPDAERAYYDLHRNDPCDSGYRNFLARLFAPLRERVPAPAQGLDFGSGPGPTLSLMFREAGYEMAIYDPYYAADTTLLQRQYDFITASEVVEHLYAPGEELARLQALLRPGGWLGLMTKLVIDQTAFSRWHYTHDPTHVCFFSRETFVWWSRQSGCELDFVGKDVILLRAPPGP
jgi:hypothetical protein